jgi:hypothetical protein
VRKTILEMLEDRGYNVGGRISEDLNQFKVQYGEMPQFVTF